MRFYNPTRCIIGTIGLPGERTFFWQITDQQSTVSIKIEKQQAAVIAEQLEALLNEVPNEDSDSEPNDFGKDRRPLDLPIDDYLELVSVGFFIEGNQVQFEIKTNEDLEELSTITIFLSRIRCLEFIDRTKSVVSAGRTSCPFCSYPVEISGHICVRANGYRR